LLSFLSISFGKVCAEEFLLVFFGAIFIFVQKILMTLQWFQKLRYSLEYERIAAVSSTLPDA